MSRSCFGISSSSIFLETPPAPPLKVNERKLLTQSKALCLNRRHQFVQSEDYTSYMEKRFAKGMCITLKSEGIWTIEEDCSKSNSKEKEVQYLCCV